MYYLLILGIIIFLFLTINFWEMIYKNSRKTDLVKWCLSDKLIAKNFAEKNGFKVANIYQYANIHFNSKTFIKLCN